MKRLLLGLLLAALAATAAAQTQVGSTAFCGSVTVDSPSISCSFTVSGHPNRWLMFVVSNIRISAGLHTIAGTYNGVAMSTGLSGACAANGNGTLRTCILSMKEASLPAAGSNTAVINSVTSDSQMTVDIIEFWNVNQTTPAANDATTSGSSTTPSVTVSSAAGNIAFGVNFWRDTKTASVNGGETLIFNDATGVGTAPSQAASYEAGAASVALDWLMSLSVSWKMDGFSIQSAGTVPTPTPTPSPTPTATPTATPTPTATLTPTSTPTSGFRAHVASLPNRRRPQPGGKR